MKQIRCWLHQSISYIGEIKCEFGTHCLTYCCFLCAQISLIVKDLGLGTRLEEGMGLWFENWVKGKRY